MPPGSTTVSISSCSACLRRRRQATHRHGSCFGSGFASVGRTAWGRRSEHQLFEYWAHSVRGQTSDERRAARQQHRQPGTEALHRLLATRLGQTIAKSKLAEEIRYATTCWAGLARFHDDGRIKFDNNVVERTIRPLALNRNKALFAGSDDGGEHWAVVASLIEASMLNAVDPQAWLADTLARLVVGHSNLRRDDPMPWNSIRAGR